MGRAGEQAGSEGRGRSSILVRRGVVRCALGALLVGLVWGRVVRGLRRGVAEARDGGGKRGGAAASGARGRRDGNEMVA